MGKKPAENQIGKGLLKLELSVIIPVYNEEKVIEENLTALNRFLSSRFDSFEIIVVNDGSTDRTLEILKKIPFIQLITYTQNKGKGYAVKRGILRSKGDYIFFTDADLAYSPENILLGIQLLKSEQTEYIIGIRQDKKQDYPFFRRIASDIFSKIVSVILNLDAEDTQCGFKGFKKGAAKNIFPQIFIEGFGFDFELLFKAGLLNLRCSKLPVRFVHSEDSAVKIYRDAFNMFFSVLKIKYRSYKLEKIKHQPF